MRQKYEHLSGMAHLAQTPTTFNQTQVVAPLSSNVMEKLRRSAETKKIFENSSSVLNNIIRQLITKK